MVVNIKYNINALCKKVLQEQLEKLQLTYNQLGSMEVFIPDDIPPEKMQLLEIGLNEYGGEIVKDNKSILVQKIKDTIINMIYSEEKLRPSKVSFYLSEKLNYTYGYLANIFSEIGYSTIENFIIIQKVERAKHLITKTDLNLSEIAWKLNYSSPGHFSTQFKNATGLTPTVFKRIIEKRRQPIELLQIE